MNQISDNIGGISNVSGSELDGVNFGEDSGDLKDSLESVNDIFSSLFPIEPPKPKPNSKPNPENKVIAK
jgi:hypothetical protein